MNDDPRDNTSAGQRSMATKLMYTEIYSNTANGLQMIAMLRYEAEGRLRIADKRQTLLECPLVYPYAYLHMIQVRYHVKAGMLTFSKRFPVYFL